MEQFSDYIVFVDESGDHGLETIDPGYPIFVLAFCVIRKEDYVRQLTPDMQALKFEYFGHDNVILHERDIRKDMGDFSSLKPREKKDTFINGVTNIVEKTPFALVCSVIKKEPLKQQYVDPGNPYHIALAFGLERVFYYLRAKGAIGYKTHVVVEKRGRKEDDELELEFRRVCDGANYERVSLPFEIEFMDKRGNSAGLQLADLVARPVGLHILRSGQSNRAYDVIKTKFYSRPSGEIQGWGLKCFP